MSPLPYRYYEVLAAISAAPLGLPPKEIFARCTAKTGSEIKSLQDVHNILYAICQRRPKPVKKRDGSSTYLITPHGNELLAEHPDFAADQPNSGTTDHDQSTDTEQRTVETVDSQPAADTGQMDWPTPGMALDDRADRPQSPDQPHDETADHLASEPAPILLNPEYEIDAQLIALYECIERQLLTTGNQFIAKKHEKLQLLDSLTELSLLSGETRALLFDIKHDIEQLEAA